jgi:hypothetical protein
MAMMNWQGFAVFENETFSAQSIIFYPLCPARSLKKTDCCFGSFLIKSEIFERQPVKSLLLDLLSRGLRLGSSVWSSKFDAWLE